MLETVFQLRIPYDGPLPYCIAFVATVLFYNYPYARNFTSPSNNPRTAWYARHHKWIMRSQLILAVVLLFLLGWLLLMHGRQIGQISAASWWLMLVFPVVGAMYYGSNFLSKKHNLRQIGWLKPFVIGFVWAGVSNVYPILYHNLFFTVPYEPTFRAFLLFFKSLMFVSMLAILFDIKDYEADSENQLKTLVVKLGLQKTIFYVVFPLTLLGLLTFLSYAVHQQFSLLKMVLLMVPFFALLAAARSLRKSRTLMYYLVVIDGLFIVKAFFGILSSVI